MKSHSVSGRSEFPIGLRCKVLPGLFEHERLAIVEDPVGTVVASVVVDSSLVRTETEPKRDVPVPGSLRIRLLEDAELANVALPASSLERGRVIAVSRQLLIAF